MEGRWHIGELGRGHSTYFLCVWITIGGIWVGAETGTETRGGHYEGGGRENGDWRWELDGIGLRAPVIA